MKSQIALLDQFKRIKKNWRTSYTVITLIVIFGVIGTFLTIRSFAAPNTIAMEAEAGTLSASAQRGASSQASGGQYVEFKQGGSGGGAGGARAQYEPADGQVYIGANAGPENITSFANLIGKPTFAIWGWYSAADGGDGRDCGRKLNNFDDVIFPESKKHNITPMISWNIPFNCNEVLNGTSNGGTNNSHIIKQAQQAKTYGKPIFMRPNWEMNGDWYAGWSIKAGVSQDLYKQSWRKLHDLVEPIAPNVAWVWCPNQSFSENWPMSYTWYPGDAYVDWICIDAYPFNNMFNRKDGVDEQTRFAAMEGVSETIQAETGHRVRKPMMLGEWGPNSANDGTPVNDIFDWSERFPNTVKALVYFHVGNGDGNYRLDAAHNAAAKTAFLNRIKNPRYIYGPVQ